MSALGLENEQGAGADAGPQEGYLGTFEETSTYLTKVGKQKNNHSSGW